MVVCVFEVNYVNIHYFKPYTGFLPEALLAYGYCHRLCVCQFLLVRTISETCKNGVCWTIPHRTWRHIHTDFYIFVWWQGRAMDLERVLTNRCETIGVLPAFDSAIGSGFYKPLLVFVKLNAPHVPIFYIKISATTVQLYNSIHLPLFVRVSHSPINPFFSAVVNTRHLVCFTS